MKKTLLIIVAVALCTSLMAQKKVHIATQATNVPKPVAYTIGAGNEQGISTNFIPTTRSSEIIRGSFYKEIGATHYMLPTNTNSRNTVSFKPGTNDAAAVWTMGSQVAKTRGTGINYFYENDWGVIPSPEDGRIESFRCGWGGHGFTEEGEIVVSHHNGTSGMVILTREKYGEGEWKEEYLPGPDYKAGGKDVNTILWPSVVTSGNTVHMICVTEQGLKAPEGYLGHNTVPLYYRSKDGGKTWDIKHLDFEKFGMTETEIEDTRGDNYTITARGNHVAFVYADNWGYVCYMESKDGGDTWQRKVVYDFGDWSWEAGVVCSWRISPSAAAIHIDENDKIHVVFAAQGFVGRSEDTPADQFTYYKTINVGLVYWNEDMDPLTKKDLGGTISSTTISLDYYDYSGYIPLLSVLGFDEFNYFWDKAEGTIEMDFEQFRRNGLATYPRITSKGNNVYIAYQAPLDAPLAYFSPDGNAHYRGIFVTVSDDNGKTWNNKNTSWITYNPNIFWVEKDEWATYKGPQFVPDPEYPGDSLPVLPEIFSFPRTENAYPSMSFNLSDNNSLMLQWFNNGSRPFLPVDETADMHGVNEIKVFAFNKPLSAFPEYNNIDEVWRGLWQDNIRENKPAINAKIYPNPANGNVTIAMDVKSAYTLTITNIMGQVVTSIKGDTPSVDLNVSNYAPGIYIVNIRTANAVTSQKLIVR